MISSRYKQILWPWGAFFTIQWSVTFSWLRQKILYNILDRKLLDLDLYNGAKLLKFKHLLNINIMKHLFGLKILQKSKPTIFPTWSEIFKFLKLLGFFFKRRTEMKFWNRH